MRQNIHILFITSLFICSSVLAEDNAEIENKKNIFMIAPSFTISYPLIASYSAGIVLTLSKQNTNEEFPSVLSLRADAEAGIGGRSLSLGVFVPTNSSFSLNLKASRIRTWLVGDSEIKNKTYEGVIFELIILGHVPGKIGLGYFKKNNETKNQKNEFTYMSFGVGW